jgi:hypothetical protein
MPLLRSFEFFILSQPPVETGGYKYCAPTELTVGTCCARPFVWNRNVFGHTTTGRAQHVPTLHFEGLMNGTKRLRFPDLIRRGGGRSTFKRAAVEDMAVEQGKLL